MAEENIEKAASDNLEPIPSLPQSKTSTGVPKEEMVKNKLVIQGLKKTQMLLAYGAENGFDIAKSDIETFTNFKHSAMDGEWSPQEEADFWEAYANIAKALGNVRAKEIEAITIDDQPSGWLSKVLKMRTSAAQRVANSYTLASLLFVVIMLIVQVYSLVGNNLLNKAKDAQTKILELQTKRSELWDQVTQLGGKVYLTFDKAIEERDGLKDTADNPQKLQIVEAKMKLQKINSDMWQLYMELTTVVFKIDSWMPGSDGSQSKELKKYYDSKDSAELKWGFYRQTLYMTPEESYAEQMDIIQSVLTSAHSPLDVMNLYILPLLYGLIGAFAFVLRNFTEQLERIDYSRDSNIKFLLRLFLGALVGLTVRMFFDTSDTSGLAAYSPLAISFISGYSVEFFFAMVDNLIKKIAPEAQQNQQKSTEF